MGAIILDALVYWLHVITCTGMKPISHTFYDHSGVNHREGYIIRTVVLHSRSRRGNTGRYYRVWFTDGQIACLDAARCVATRRGLEYNG